jgi:hypothetical protein
MIGMEVASRSGLYHCIYIEPCPYSGLYEDRIILLHTKYAGSGYSILAIQPNNPQLSPKIHSEKMKERKKRRQLPFSYLIDEVIKKLKPMALRIPLKSLYCKRTRTMTLEIYWGDR